MTLFHPTRIHVRSRYLHLDSLNDENTDCAPSRQYLRLTSGQLVSPASPEPALDPLPGSDALRGWHVTGKRPFNGVLHCKGIVACVCVCEKASGLFAFRIKSSSNILAHIWGRGAGSFVKRADTIAARVRENDDR